MIPIRPGREGNGFFCIARGKPLGSREIASEPRGIELVRDAERLVGIQN